MALLGDILVKVGLQDNFSTPLLNVKGALNSAVAPMKTIGDATTVSGLAITGMGHALTKMGPGFDEVGKLTRGFGLAQSAIGGFLSGFSRLYERAQMVTKALHFFGGVWPMIQVGMAMASSAVAGFMTTLLPLIPIILAVAAVGFALYTIWSENLGGIQDIVMGVFGDISAILSGVLDFMKGFVVGVMDGLVPAFTVLGAVVSPILKSLSWLAGVFMKSSDGAFNMGRVIGKILAPAFLLLGIYLLTIVVPALWAMAVALMANPITWIVLGVVALIAALVFLFKWIGKLIEKFGVLKVVGAILFGPMIIPILLMVKLFKWLWGVTTKWREALMGAIMKLKWVQNLVKGLQFLWDLVKKSFMAALEPWIKMFEMAKQIWQWFFGGGEDKEKEKGMEEATDTLNETGGSGVTNAPVSRTTNQSTSVNVEGGISNEADSDLLAKKVARQTAGELGGIS